MEKKGLSSPKKAFTNNKPELAIRDDEETERCREVKNASQTERKHLAQKRSDTTVHEYDKK